MHPRLPALKFDIDLNPTGLFAYFKYPSLQLTFRDSKIKQNKIKNKK
jgi:hypothetical protein